MATWTTSAFRATSFTTSTTSLIRDVEVHHNLVFNSNYRNLTLGEVENSREYDNRLVDDPDLADAGLEACK